MTTAKTLVILALTLVGLLDSIYLMNHHHKIRIAAPKTASFCVINETFDCDEVANSKYALIFNLPTATLGTFAYLFLTLLIIGGLWMAPNRQQEIFSLIFWVALVMLGFSLYMATTSWVKLGKLCIMCMVLYGTILALTILVKTFIQLPLGNTIKQAFHFINGQIKLGILSLGALVIASFLVTLMADNAIQDYYQGQVNQKSVVQNKPKSATPPAQTSLDEPPEDPIKQLMEAYYALPTEEIVTAASPSKGNNSASVEIVDFSDFECGHCSKAATMLKSLLQRFPNRLKVIYKHYPLDKNCNEQIKTNFHKLACLAAEYSYCAFAQGKFWAFHDRIFENQKYLSQSFIQELANNAGLDKKQFQTCLENKAPNAIRNETKEGNKIGLAFTPTIFINKRRVSNLSQGATMETLESIIRELLR